jgi:hypothetical protein
MKKLLSTITILAITGCASDGTITALHPKKPVRVKDEFLCEVIPDKKFEIDDTSIPANVGAGKTFSSTHGETFLKEPISKTLEQKISCRLQDDPDFAANIDTITVNKLEIGYKNIVFAWETSCTLIITTTLKSGENKEFNSTTKSASTSFTIGASMNKVYNNALDDYLNSI